MIFLYCLLPKIPKFIQVGYLWVKVALHTVSIVLLRLFVLWLALVSPKLTSFTAMGLAIVQLIVL